MFSVQLLYGKCQRGNRSYPTVGQRKKKIIVKKPGTKNIPEWKCVCFFFDAGRILLTKYFCPSNLLRRYTHYSKKSCAYKAKIVIYTAIIRPVI